MKEVPYWIANPVHRIGIIAAPDLRRIVQHTGIKSSAASAAALQQNIRIPLQELFQKIIDTENVFMQNHSLISRLRRIYIEQASVHIPLDIFHMRMIQHLADLFLKTRIPDRFP